MSSGLSHALALALTAAAHHKVNTAGDDLANFARTSGELAEGHIAKKEAESALSSAINLIDNEISKIRKDVVRGESHAAAPVAKVADAANESPVDIAKRLNQQMSKDGLKEGVTDLSQMAKSIEPIITKFDETLKQPYLNEYSATINTVPVVGLKNNGKEIIYVNVKSGYKNGIPNVVEQWDKFADLPSGVQIKDGDHIFLFPYKGDFFFAQGKTVWKKAHRPQGDPELTKAVNDWPHMYVNEWEKVGENVLPTADLLGVAPFAVLSADREVLGFHLVILSADGTLAALKGDQLVNNAQFETLSYLKEKGGPDAAPKWSKIAYWNNNIVAVDNLSNIWDVTPTFQSANYKVSNKDSIQSVTEFTATDAGVVGLRADGYLYRRLVQAPRDDKGEAILEWTRWIKADGATHLGVASPGVMLDLETLTRSLRARYIDTQTAVYPVVDKIRAFGITHATFLDQLKKDAEAWQAADDKNDDAAKAIAIAAAKKFVGHAKQWGKIVSSSVGGAKETVNIMTDQLKGVRNDLDVQLSKLRDDLTALKHTLAVQQETLSKLNAAFWGSIAALFLGIIVVAIGVGTGLLPVIIGGGVLFAAGLTAAIVFGIKVTELRNQMSATEARIAKVTTAIDQLSTVTANFNDLYALYQKLNVFWGRMSNDASAIKTMDNVTAQAIGEEVLYDTSSIDAARDMTDQMRKACEIYLDVLNKQGVKIPEN